MSEDLVYCPVCKGSKFFLLKYGNEVKARCCECWLRKQEKDSRELVEA